MWDEQPTVRRIPGFVFPDIQNAIANFDEFIGWTHGPTEEPHIYEMEAPSPFQFPLAFMSRLSFNPKRRPPKKLTQQQTQQAVQYFDKQDLEFFGLAAATEQDVLLFHDLAATLGTLKSADNSYIDELFVGIPVAMRLYQ